MSGTVNRAPVVQDDEINIRPSYMRPDPNGNQSYIDYFELLGNDRDPEGGRLTLVSIEPTPGTGTGDWAELTDENASAIPFYIDDQSIRGEGVATFTYTVADEGGLTATGTLRILYGVTDPPPEQRTVAEDTRLFVTSYTISGGGAFSYTQPEHGIVYQESNPEYGREQFVYYQPDADFNGLDSFRLEAGQNGYRPTYYKIDVEVTPVADAPVANADAVTTTANTPLVIPFAQLLANDTDADGDTLRVVAVEGSVETQKNGTPGLSADGVTFAPSAGFIGQTTFTYIVQDATGLETAATVTVTVNPGGPPPPTGSYVRGTAGADNLDLSASTTRVQIAGLDGNDTLRGGSANDALNGGAGNDVISGGGGNDLITGGAGVDRVSGGAGVDTFLIALGDLALTNATDLIYDFQGAGVVGGDVIRFTGFAAGSTLAMLGTSGNAMVYEVRDTQGGYEGRLLVSAGGTAGAALAAGDYVFS